jgi:hypothetical protein
MWLPRAKLWKTASLVLSALLQRLRLQRPDGTTPQSIMDLQDFLT